MPSARAFYRWSELDRTSWPAWRDDVAAFASAGPAVPRSHPGLPRLPLPSVRARRLASLDRALVARRSADRLAATPPSDAVLAHLLRFAHGAWDGQARGPVPSAGGLQAVELYPVLFGRGAFHYDRAAHALARLDAPSAREDWTAVVPSLALLHGGAILWLVVGDAARVEPKYAARGLRFLLLEAGHLMQNLCVLSSSRGLSTVPLGGVFEREAAGRLGLPDTDLVLYAGLCGKALQAARA